TDLDNGKKVDVRVNDRGPFVHHRIIDLSLAAAREIDMVGPGTARVKLKVIAAPRSFPAATQRTIEQRTIEPSRELPGEVSGELSASFYAVQAGAFSTAERADSFAASLRPNFDETRVESSGTVWRVLIGRALSIEEAKRLAEKVRTAT